MSNTKQVITMREGTLALDENNIWRVVGLGKLVAIECIGGEWEYRCGMRTVPLGTSQHAAFVAALNLATA